MPRDDKITILRRETSIAWIWNYLGLPGKADRTCKSPFRDDSNASFSVWRTKDGDKWKDFATDEGGDCIDFWAKAKGISIGYAIREMLDINNLSSPPVVRKPVEKEREKPSVPVWRKPTQDECRTLGKLRGLDAAAFDLAGELGTLQVGHHPQTKELLWWLLDASGHAAEGRTFDGQACQCSGKKVTALPGSKKDFPIGLKTANPHYDALPRVVMVEGSGDYYAGLHIAIRVGFNFITATMLGANCNIGEAALPLFDSKHVLILAHNDDAGQSAANRWKDQLSAKATSVMVQPLPTGVKDLNDLLLMPLFSIQ